MTGAPDIGSVELPYQGRWPVRDHLRPRERRKVVTEADIAPWLLALHPDLVEGSNQCPGEVFMPGRGWVSELFALDFVLSLPFSGEA
jgi:hypothetical protein